MFVMLYTRKVFVSRKFCHFHNHRWLTIISSYFVLYNYDVSGNILAAATRDIQTIVNCVKHLKKQRIFDVFILSYHWEIRNIHQINKSKLSVSYQGHTFEQLSTKNKHD